MPWSYAVQMCAVHPQWHGGCGQALGSMPKISAPPVHATAAPAAQQVSPADDDIADVEVPAAAVLAPLQPAKQALYRAVVQQVCFASLQNGPDDCLRRSAALLPRSLPGAGTLPDLWLAMCAGCCCMKITGGGITPGIARNTFPPHATS